MIYILLIAFQFTDSISLNYSYLIPGKFTYRSTLQDSFSLLIDYEMDSRQTIYILDYQPNCLKSYSVNSKKKKLLALEQLSSYSRYIILYNNLILIEGDSNQIFDHNLKLVANLQNTTADILYGIGNFSGKTRAIFKGNLFRRDFYTIDVGSTYKLEMATKQEFPWVEDSHFSFLFGILIEQNRVILSYAKRYQIETVDQANRRILYTRQFKRIKELVERMHAVYTKASGVVSNQFITNNMNGYYKGKFQDDILDIMGTYNGYYFIQTSRPDENRLDFDVVDFNKKSYRHFFLTFKDHVSSAKVRNGKLLVEIRDKTQAKLVIYDINK